MSYYGVSVIITILLTSLIAFYLLYKAKEFNLGIVISISIGSVILGFSFSPAFKAVLKLLSSNINEKLALVLSLLTVLFVFLLFILIISFIVSICIPKKLASIDCCIIIDKLISKISIKTAVNRIKDKFDDIWGKIVFKMRKTVKNVYKLKKPVDTKQIIDTMGIEKSINVYSYEEGNEVTDTSDTFAFSNLLGFMEPSNEVTYENQNNSVDTDIIGHTVEATDNLYRNLAAIAYEEVVTTQISDFETDDANDDDIDDLAEITIKVDVDDQLVEAEVIITEEVTEDELTDINLTLIETIESNIFEDEVTEEIVRETELNQVLPSIEHNEPELVTINANSLILKALESKDEGRKEDSIAQYIEALQLKPDNEMIFWIVLDVCALYKQLGLSELAKNILEGLVSEYGSVIQPEIKMEIMNNLE